MTTTRAAERHGCGHARRNDALPGWARGWAYAGCLIPLLGLTAADTFWMVGMPVDLLVRGVRAAWQAPGPAFAVVVVVLPAAGALLILVLAGRSGRLSPTVSLTPDLAGRPGRTAPAARRIPRLAAVTAVAVVTVALTVYGVLGSALVAQDLLTSTVTWSRLRADWSGTGAGLVVLAWLVSLAVATVGYRLGVRAGCRQCDELPADPAGSVQWPVTNAGPVQPPEMTGQPVAEVVEVAARPRPPGLGRRRQAREGTELDQLRCG